MAALFNLEIHTPYRLFYNGEAQSVTLKLFDGEICAYANHCLITALVFPCTLRIKDANGELRTAFISDGIFQIKEFKYVLIVNSAEWPDEIDKDLALAVIAQAEEALKNPLTKLEAYKAKEKLKRAQCRLKVLEGICK